VVRIGGPAYLLNFGAQVPGASMVNGHLSLTSAPDSLLWTPQASITHNRTGRYEQAEEQEARY